MSVADSSQSEKLTRLYSRAAALIEELHKNIKFNYPELFSDEYTKLKRFLTQLNLYSLHNKYLLLKQRKYLD